MDLTNGNVWKKLILFTLPIILTLLLSQVYVLTDSIIVSNLIEESALAKISPSSQVLGLFQGVSMGIGIAVGIIVANLIGSKKMKDVKSAAVTSLIISFVLGIIIVALAMALGYPLFLMVNVPKDIFDEAFRLYFIYVWTILLTILGNTLTTILTSIGDSLRPFIISSISGLTNVLLDLVFIKWCGLGISSCAYATLASQFILIVLAFIMVRKSLNNLSIEKVKYNKIFAHEIFRLGIPSIIQQTVMSLGSLFIVSLIYSYGSEIIAGNVAAEQINNLLFIPAVAITNAYATFASQNFGAGNQSRLNEGFKVMHILGLIVNTFICIIAVFLVKYFIYLYTGSYESVSYQYAYIYIMLCLPYYYFIVFKYGFDSLFKAKKQIQLFIYSSVFNLGTRIALAYLFSYLYGCNFINLSMPISTLLAGIFNLFLWKFSKKYKKASEAIFNTKEKIGTDI